MIGDLGAVIAACERGKNKLVELVDKYSLEHFREVVKELKDYAERRTRVEIEEIPGGTYEAKDIIHSLPARVLLLKELKNQHLIVIKTWSVSDGHEYRLYWTWDNGYPHVEEPDQGRARVDSI